MLKCYMHVHLSFYSYTLIGKSDSLDLHIQVFACYLTDQVFREDTSHRSQSSLYLIFQFRYLFLLFFITVASMILYIGLIAYSIHLFICYHCDRYLYVILQWYWFIIVIIYLVQVTLSLACISGVFSSRIYVVDSRRDSVSAPVCVWRKLLS